MITFRCFYRCMKLEGDTIVLPDPSFSNYYLIFSFYYTVATGLAQQGPWNGSFAAPLKIIWRKKFNTSRVQTEAYHCTVKRVDGKLRQLDRMTQYSSVRGMEHFFDMQIELIRRFPTINTKYFDVQRNCSTVFRCQATEFSDNFPSTFRWMNQNQKMHHRRDWSRDL